MTKKTILILVASGAIPLIACAAPARQAAAATEGPAISAEARELNAIFTDEWSARLTRDPLFASEMGVETYNDALPTPTAENQRRWLDEDRRFLDRLHAVNRSALSPEDRLNYDLFEFVVRSRATLARYRPYLIPILSDDGFHVRIERMYESMPFEDAADYEDYLSRLDAVGDYFDQNIANMREGLELGITQPKIILDGIEASIRGPIVEHAEDSVFFAPFATFPQHFSADERERLRDAGVEAIETVVIPAYRRFLTFFNDEYRQGARERIGRSTFPDGEAWYADLVRYYTTLEHATPEAIHALGLHEVARIRGEMDEIIRQVKFEGSFAEFIKFLRTDERFYADSPKELLEAAALIAKKIDGQMPAFFKTLPRLPYGIMPVPPDIAPNYTTGRYWEAPIGGHRGGYYLVNTYALDKRPLYALPALTAHEAVPGHHHQIALRQELENIPDFRRAFYPHAFGEGWGLYSEKLGIDFGIYETPYDDFGRLSYEMWRACRLVIDTGIHAKGWSREHARAYLADNTALSLHNVQTEVDRYIAWPGQALAYKMGELKILELKARARRKLGPAFDIREFHDVVLLDGGVTLDILEHRVEDYIRETKASTVP
ncbi:MAG TPA: DUF885 domain-containing protein [Woeseiaceae bacterium]|nr:DUF885 domain-containing protein [Woeseiaceae bacterium]